MCRSVITRESEELETQQHLFNTVAIETGMNFEADVQLDTLLQSDVHLFFRVSEGVVKKRPIAMPSLKKFKHCMVD